MNEELIQNDNLRELVEEISTIRYIRNQISSKFEIYKKILEYQRLVDYFKHPKPIDLSIWGSIQEYTDSDNLLNILESYIEQDNPKDIKAHINDYISHNVLEALHSMHNNINTTLSDFRYNRHEYFLKRINVQEIKTKELYRVNVGYGVIEIKFQDGYVYMYHHCLNDDCEEIRSVLNYSGNTLEVLIEIAKTNENMNKVVKEYLKEFFAEEFV